MGRADADRRDELGGSSGGRPALGHRPEEPEFLASRPGLGRVEGLHRRAQEARRRPPLDSFLDNLFLKSVFFFCSAAKK